MPREPSAPETGRKRASRELPTRPSPHAGRLLRHDQVDGPQKASSRPGVAAWKSAPPGPGVPEAGLGRSSTAQRQNRRGGCANGTDTTIGSRSPCSTLSAPSGSSTRASERSGMTPAPVSPRGPRSGDSRARPGGRHGRRGYAGGGGPPSVCTVGRSSRTCFRYISLSGDRFRHSRWMLYQTFRRRLGSESRSGYTRKMFR